MRNEKVWLVFIAGQLWLDYLSKSDKDIML